MVGKRGQAKRLKESLGYYRTQRRRLHVDGVVWFSWQDSANSVCKWCARSGLLTSSGKAKPALRAMRSARR